MVWTQLIERIMHQLAGQGTEEEVPRHHGPTPPPTLGSQDTSGHRPTCVHVMDSWPKRASTLCSLSPIQAACICRNNHFTTNLGAALGGPRGTPALHFNEAADGSCCDAGLGLVWRCYWIYMSFVCLIQKKIFVLDF